MRTAVRVGTCLVGTLHPLASSASATNRLMFADLSNAYASAREVDILCVHHSGAQRMPRADGILELTALHSAVPAMRGMVQALRGSKQCSSTATLSPWST